MLQIKVGADIKEAIAALKQFGTEIDKAGGVTEATAQKMSSALNKALATVKNAASTKVEFPDIDLSKQFEEARQKINAQIDANVNRALGINVEETVNVNTQPAIKSIQQLENEMDELRQKIAGATNIQDIQNLSVQFGALQAEANKLKAVFADFSKLKITGAFNGGLVQQVRAFGGGVTALQNPLQRTQAAMNATVSANARFRSSTNASTQTMVDFGRILQDAPFGLIGIANNINPLVEGFRRLSLESKAAGVSVGKQLLSSLTGAGGLALAFSGITAALQFAVVGMSAWTRGFGGAKAKVDELKDSLKDLIKPIEEIRATATGGQSGEIAQVQALSNVILDQTQSYEKRNRALNELKEINKNYFGDLTLEQSKLETLKTKVDEYSNALISQAVVKAFSDDIGNLTKELFKQQIQLGKTQAEYNKLSKATQQATKDANKLQQSVIGGSTVQAPLINTSEQIANKALSQAKKVRDAQLDAVNQLFNQVQELKTALNGAVQESLKFKPLNVETETQDKSKFEFLFDFLPFDPSGRLKPEQRSQLLNAIDKFSNEFQGILKGVNFNALAKTQEEKINLAIAFDADLKAGNVKIDLTKIREETQKALKPEDLLPDGLDFAGALKKLDESRKAAIDQFIRSGQNESERIKTQNPLNLSSLFNINTDLSAQLDLFKTNIQRIGAQIPKSIDGKDIFGNPIELKLEDLFDLTKISNAEAIAALRKAFDKIFNQVNDFKGKFTQILQSVATDTFVAFGTAIGNAISGGGIGNAFQSLFSLIGGAMADLGKQMIAMSPIIAGLKAAIKTLNPALMLPAGIALVAIGSALRNIKPKGFNKGGFVPGAGNTDTVPAMLTPGEYVIRKQDVPLILPLLKMLKGGISRGFSVARSLPLHFAEGGFVPNISADVKSPLNKLQSVLIGTANQNINVTVNGGWRGNDFVLGVAKVLQSQGRNFGRSSF